MDRALKHDCAWLIDREPTIAKPNIEARDTSVLVDEEFSAHIVALLHLLCTLWLKHLVKQSSESVAEGAGHRVAELLDDADVSFDGLQLPQTIWDLVLSRVETEGFPINFFVYCKFYHY